MGLTEHQQELIRAIANNDIIKAKKVALSCLAEDGTQKNKYFVERYAKILTEESSEIKVPQNIQHMVQVRDVSNFKANRYYLSEREEAAFNHISLMRKAALRLKDLEIPYMNTTLLYGESGTGKTTFGEYVAYKMELPFCYLNATETINSYLGSTAKNLHNVFNFVKSFPCVFMIDEIDSITTKRTIGDETNADSEMVRVTISLMQALDKISNEHIIIGATNRMDRIDRALLRRFSLHHEVKTLKENERRILVNEYLKDVGVALNNDDVEEMVSHTENQALLLNKLINKIAEKFYNE